MFIWETLDRPSFDVTKANRNLMKSITVILSYLLHITDLLTLVMFSMYLHPLIVLCFSGNTLQFGVDNITKVMIYVFV